MGRRRAWTLAAALLLLGGCRRPSADVVVETEDPFPEPVAAIPVGDPRLAPLLLSGWHAIEEGRWRWTARRFTVLLRTPPEGQAATLKLAFVLPEVVAARLGAVSLEAKVNGTALGPQSYRRAGEQVYARPVPPQAWRGEAAQVEFTLDRALPPSPSDARELGLTVSEVGFY